MIKYLMIAVAVLTAVCGVLGWLLDSATTEIGALKGQLRAKDAIIVIHEKNIKITEEVSNAYQNNINELNADLNRLRRQPAKCIPITRSARISIKPASKPELSERDGLSDQWLYDFAGRAEQTRLTLIACQDFINQVKQQGENNE